MYGCICGCGGWGYSPRLARWAGPERQVEWLEEYQRDLEQRVADVADEIKRIKDRTYPTS